MCAESAACPAPTVSHIHVPSGNTTNSYRSSSGAFSSTTPLNYRGTLQTNGYIKLNGGARVNGDAYTGAGQTVSTSGGSSVSGNVAELSVPLDYPPQTAGAAATTNDNSNIPPAYLNARRDLTVNSDLTLPGGVYYLNDVNLTSTASLSFSGPVTMYVTGSVSLSGGVRTNDYRAINLNIIVVGTGSFSLSGSSYLFANIYAPQSAFSMSGGSVLLGSVIAKTVSMSGSAMVVFDEDLSASAGVTLVK